MSVALLVLVAGELFTRGLAPLETGAGKELLSAQACVGCHAAAHGEWKQSRHGLAWTNAIFQREYKDQPLEWCVHCHAPLREQLAEVRAGGGALAAEGVGCAACHLREGRMIAREKRAGSPHATEARADFGSPAFCAGCHQFNFPIIEERERERRVVGYSRHPMQDTVAQHARGPLAATACRDCHTSPAGHAFPGGHDPGMLARAVTLDACRERAQLRLTLTNSGAGHNVPTGDLHRHLVLRAWLPQAPERLHETLLGRRFAPAPDGGKRAVLDTTLPPRSARVARIPVASLGEMTPDQAIRVELRLVYTIDEFPFPRRQLAEPTYATMKRETLSWAALPACARPPARRAAVAKTAARAGR